MNNIEIIVGLVLRLREVLHRRWWSAGWLLLTGLFLTLFAILLLPAGSQEPETQPRTPTSDRPPAPEAEAAPARAGGIGQGETRA